MYHPNLARPPAARVSSRLIGDDGFFITSAGSDDPNRTSESVILENGTFGQLAETFRHRYETFGHVYEIFRHVYGTFCHVAETFCPMCETFGHMYETFGHVYGTFCHVAEAFRHWYGTFGHVYRTFRHVAETFRHMYETFGHMAKTSVQPFRVACRAYEIDPYLRHVDRSRFPWSCRMKNAEIIGARRLSGKKLDSMKGVASLADPSSAPDNVRGERSGESEDRANCAIGTWNRSISIPSSHPTASTM